MTTTTSNDFTRAAQDATLDAVQKSQETVVEAVRVWAKAVEKTVPTMPVSVS